MELTILILISVLLTISSFFLSTIGCICVISACIILNCCYFCFLRKRRERLKELSMQLDLLLHEDTPLPISEYCEGELIDRAAAPLSIPLELRGLQLAVSCSSESLTADPVWTAEAIGNLLKNSMEHTPPGGTITVTAEHTALYTAITVEDTGCGFDEADLPHLFERFYKGKNASASSYGIGLALARTIIAAQNGTIQAMNTGTGAKFLIKFYHQVL